MSLQQVSTRTQAGLNSPPPTPRVSLDSTTSQAHSHQTKSLRRPVTKKYQSRVQYLLERCKRNNEQQARDRAKANHRKLRILAGYEHKSKTNPKSKPESNSIASADEFADSFSESSEADVSSGGLSPDGVSTSRVKASSASHSLPDTPTTEYAPVVLGEKTASGGVIVSTSRGLFQY